eukprot:6295716-Pyramimonas_sp.AAC.1
MCWELCGGSGGISQLAFSRALSPGGNLDKRLYVDLGNKDVQDAVMHCWGVCIVNVGILQPICRTTGLPSSIHKSTMTRGMNTMRETFHLSRVVGGLPCVKMTSDGFLRGRPMGTWVDKKPPWPTLAKCEGTSIVCADQCTTGLRDPLWGISA